MARLLTSGCEMAADEFGANAAGSPRDTTHSRLGVGACWSCDSTVSNVTSAVQFIPGPAITASVTYFYRAYIRFDALPSSTATVMHDGGSKFLIRLTTSGTLQLWNGLTSSQIGSDSAAIATGTYYRIEVSATINASTQISQLEFSLDGTVVATSGALSIATSGSVAVSAGWAGAPGASKICYVDDVAINDSTGAAQTSYPGDGKVVLLGSISDNAKGTGWTNDQASTTNLFASVDSTPPVGIADTTTGGGGHQIRNATSNANTNYDANMTSYATAGIAAGDTINVVVPVVATGAPVTTSAKAGTVGVVSNPTIANVSLGAGGTAGAFWSGVAAGNYPTGWKWSSGTITYAPSVTLGTSPVMRITQVTSSTRIAMVCAMGIYVDYTPAVVATVMPPRPTVVLQAVNRASSW